MDPFSGAIRPVFTFPDGHHFLDCINQPLACGEGGGAVGGADGDGDAGFAKFQVAEAMDDGAAGEGPAAAGLGFQFGQLLLGHLGIALIVERCGAAALGEFASGTQEQNDRAGVVRGHLGQDGGGVDGFLGEGNHE